MRKDTSKQKPTKSSSISGEREKEEFSFMESTIRVICVSRRARARLSKQISTHSVPHKNQLKAKIQLCNASPLMNDKWLIHSSAMSAHFHRNSKSHYNLNNCSHFSCRYKRFLPLVSFVVAPSCITAQALYVPMLLVISHQKLSSFLFL